MNETEQAAGTVAREDMMTGDSMPFTEAVRKIQQGAEVLGLRGVDPRAISSGLPARVIDLLLTYPDLNSVGLGRRLDADPLRVREAADIAARAVGRRVKHFDTETFCKDLAEKLTREGRPVRIVREKPAPEPLTVAEAARFTEEPKAVLPLGRGLYGRL